MSIAQPLNDHTVTIDCLALQHQSIKHRQKELAAELAECEKLIIERCGAKEEGSTTFTGDTFKITTTGKVTRSINAEQLEVVANRIGFGAAEKVFKRKFTIDTKNLKAMKEFAPDAYAIACDAITMKPAKTAVTVKPIEEE